MARIKLSRRMKPILMVAALVVSTSAVVAVVSAPPASASPSQQAVYDASVASAGPAMWWPLAGAGYAAQLGGANLYAITPAVPGVVSGPMVGSTGVQLGISSSCSEGPPASQSIAQADTIHMPTIGPNFSLEFWVRPVDPGHHTGVQALTLFYAGNFTLQMFEDGSTSAWANDGVNTTQTAVVGGDEQDAWHHVVAVVTATTLTAYVNGQASASVSRVGIAQPWTNNTYIGLVSQSCKKVGPYFGSDSVAEAAIYPSALQPIQIARNACLGGVQSACSAAGNPANGFGNTAARRGGLTGEPVNTSTGNMTETYTDVKAPAGVYGMDFVRSYNSQDGADGLLGAGWTTTLDTSVTPYGSEGYVLREGDGRRWSILSDGAGGWTMPPDLYASLSTPGSGPVITFKTGETWTFDTSGRLTGMNNALGQALSVTRGSGGWPITVTSSNSGVAGWSYELLGPDAHGHATAVIGPYQAGGSTTGAPEVDYGFAVSANLSRLAQASHPYASTGTPSASAWEFYDPDANGYVTTIRDDYGATGQAQLTRVSTGFDAWGGVQSQTELGGESLTFNYATPGSTSVTHQGGPGGPTEQQTFTHDANGNLTALTDPYTHVAHEVVTNNVVTSFTNRPPNGSTPAASRNYNPDASRGVIASVDLPNPTTGAPQAGAGGSVGAFCPNDARPTQATDAASVSATLAYGSGCDANTDLPSSVTVGGATTAITAQQVSGSPSNLPATTTDPDGIVHNSFWDVGRRLLLSSSDNPGTGLRTTFYGYDGAGRQLVIRTPAGVETWTVYNADGTLNSRVGPVSVTRSCPMSATSCTFPSSPPAGPTTSYAYYQDGSQKQTTDAASQTTNYAVSYPSGGGKVETMTPPAHTASDGGSVSKVTLTTSDAFGRVTSVKVGDPSRPSEAATTTNVYDDSLNPAAGALQRVSYTISPTGVHTYFTYDGDGQVINKQIGGGTPNRPGGSAPTMGSNGCWTFTSPYADPTRSTSTSYDLRGRVTDVCGPTGDVSSTGGAIRTHTHYDYDNADRVIQTTEGDTAGVQVKTRSNYDATTGMLKQTVVDPISGSGLDPHDRVTEYFYSKAGRLFDVFTDPQDVATFTWPTTTPLATLNTSGQPVLNQQGTLVTQYQYDAAGQTTKITDPNNKATNLTYTADSQLLKQTLPNGYYHQYIYDAFGNRTSDTTPSPTGSGTVSTTRVFDGRDQLSTVTKPATPGNSTASTVTNNYYPDGQLQWVTNALGGTPGPTNPNTVTYAYDSRGNRTARSSLNNPDPAQPTSYSTVTQTWGYNLADQTLSTSPDGTTGHTTSYIYDDNNNPNNATAYPHALTTTDQGTGRQLVTIQPSGRNSTKSYWASGGVDVTWSDQAGSTEVTSQTWFDERGRRTKIHDTLNGGSGEDSTFASDAFGDLTAVTRPPLPSNSNPTYSFSYDLTGHEVQVVYPDATKHAFLHDKDGRIVQSNVIWANGGQWPIVLYAYDANGNRTTSTVNWSQGSSTWTFPANHAPFATNYTQTLTTAPTTNTNLTYGADGQLASETNGSTTLSYGYDVAGQLTARSGGSANLSYTYNAHGDRVASSNGTTSTSLTLNTLDQLQTTVVTNGSNTDTTNYQWDADGRRTVQADTSTATTSTTTYDLRGLPSNITTTTNGNPVSNLNRQYNVDRQLIRYWDANPGGNSTELIWDDTAPTPVPLDAYQNTTLWVRINQGLETLGYQLSSGGNAVFFAMDAHRNVLPTTDNTLEPTSYDPYGPTSGPPPSSWFSYGDQIQFGTTIHLSNRDYDYTTGTFTTPDAIDGTNGTTTVSNPYHYVNNDPLNLTDPLGLHPLDDSLYHQVDDIKCLHPSAWDNTQSLAAGLLHTTGLDFVRQTLDPNAVICHNGYYTAGTYAGYGSDAVLLAEGGILAKGVELTTGAQEAESLSGRLQTEPAFGDKAIQNARKVPGKEGFFDVIGHGSPSEISGLSPQELANRIESDPGWGAQNVRLLSCGTGCPTGTFAQDLANELNVIVEAPSTDIYVSGRGGVTFEPGGEWILFFPRR